MHRHSALAAVHARVACGTCLDGPRAQLKDEVGNTAPTPEQMLVQEDGLMAQRLQTKACNERKTNSAAGN